MSRKIEISFSRPPKAAPGASAGLTVLLATEDGGLADGAALIAADAVERAMRVTEFKGKSMATLDIVAPADSPADRILIVGVGDLRTITENDWARLGGQICGKFGKAAKVAIHLSLRGTEIGGAEAAQMAMGILLRAYRFDRYKTQCDDNDNGAGTGTVKVTIVTPAATAAKKAFEDIEAVVGGVTLARDLVNEPANVLGPLEFAAKVKELSKLGVKVEILTEKEMRKLGMGSLLGVAQGSPRGARLAVMRWDGGKAREKPVAFVGKGVTFDTGGNSMKTASGMEDMKGDMGGAAAVTGLIYALATRKAKVNAVGIVGLVENAVDGHAQRPGDIVTSMSGQTIEVLNTDAEGRLVLADALWYCADRFQPKFMVNLATLTGAIIVALGPHYAGLFSNNDELAERLAAAGAETAERVWRMPLGPEFDKLIESKNADMKNIGGRHGGAIIAAQFLQRFVKDTPWAHLDIAGTALGAPANEINQSWASGFGVRLLDRLVRDHYEG
ncbi:MAG: leucyl aminopeptidase [Hyphomicrobiales bacterium]|nr:leucyl aminopeptidase [Hyphomicrobiales bacterium]